MRLLIGLLAAAGLAGMTGCVAYGGGYGTEAYYGQSYYSAPAYSYYSAPAYSYYQAPSYGYYSYSTPATPYYGRAYRDRDGDGVPNAYDRAPSNPRRY
jgi:hypothetical protein